MSKILATVFASGLLLAGYASLPKVVHTQPATRTRDGDHARAFTLSFNATDMIVTPAANTGTPEIRVSRLTRRDSSTGESIDRVPISKNPASASTKPSFRFGSGFAAGEIIPVEITFAHPDQDDDTSIVYLKTANGVITETNWAEYACLNKVYICGKDWKGQPAMRLARKKGRS